MKAIHKAKTSPDRPMFRPPTQAWSVRTVLSEDFFRRFSPLFAPHLEALGIDDLLLQQADVEIPGEQYIALWEAASKDNPNIGLELGGRTEANDFGALGHALHCATSVEMALRTLQRFIVVFSQESTINVQCNSRSASVEYLVNAPAILYRRQDSEFAIASILRQFELITGSAIKPLRVDFEHDKPADVSVHKRVFQCPVHFRQPSNRIHFAADAMRLPVAHGNERLYQALVPYLEQERQNRSIGDEILLQVSHLIATGMSSGALSLDDVSQQLGLNRRTLQRRLKDQDIEFSSLTEDVRRGMAMAYMRGSDYSVTEISLLVGYAESSSFTRAFRRWTGLSPQQYRASCLPQG